jgi:fructose/tagatose bisphosphate aldolase
MVESMVGHPKATALGAQDGENVAEELTDPEEAAFFANETGVDLLAVSVGTGHDRALTCGQVKLDFPLLKAIAEKVPQPLVIHGGSGIDEAQLREIRNYNVGKVNISSAIRLAYKDAIVKALAENPHMDMVAADAIGEDAIYRVALEKMRILSC